MAFPPSVRQLITFLDLTAIAINQEFFLIYGALNVIFAAFSLYTKIHTLLISRNVRCSSSTLSKA